MKKSLLLLSPVLYVCLLMTACGGGGGGSASVTPPPPPPTPLSTLTWAATPYLRGAEKDVPFSYSLQATGGTAPYTYSADAGKPGWLNLDSFTGVMSGTPTAVSTSAANFSVSVKDAKNATISANVSLNVLPSLAIDTSKASALQIATYGVVKFGVVGGMGPFKLTANGLPAGTTLYTAIIDAGPFEIRGTPTSAGTFPVSFTLTDSLNGNYTTDFPLVVSKALIIGSQQSLKAVQGRPFNASLSVTAGTPPYSFSGTPPYGLTLSSAGVISGTPFGFTPADTQFSFTVTDSDNPPKTATGWGSISLYGPVKVNSGQSTLHTGEKGNIWFANGGGFGTLSVTLTSGSLPPGMAFDPGYPTILTGTPTQTGTFNASFRVQDQATPPQFADGNVSIMVQPPAPVISNNVLPTALVGQPYSSQFGISGGVPPFVWSATSKLPAGLTFKDGAIQGTPTEAGYYLVQVQATDSSVPVQTATRTSNLVVHMSSNKSGRNDSIATATPLSYISHASISPYEDASSGPDQDYYKLLATAGSTVTIEVDPVEPLDSVLELVDANGQRFSTCNDPGDDSPDPSTGITPDPTPNGFDDQCMNDDVDLGVDRRSRLEFKVPGTAGETVTFYAHVFDWSGNARPDATYTITADANVPVLSMPDYLGVSGMVGYPLRYAQSLIAFFASGGVKPYTVTLAPGSPAMPPGLSIDPSGVINGSPTQSGRYAVKVQVSDASQPKQSVVTEVDFNIADAVNFPTAMPAAVTGVPYRQPIWQTPDFDNGYISGTNWNPNQCCLNTWNGTGVRGIAGTTQYVGDFTFTYTITNSLYLDGTHTLTIHVDPGPFTVSASVPPRAQVYNYYDLIFTPNGGSAPYAYSAVGTLPPGLSLTWNSGPFSSAMGELSGYPTKAGTYPITLNVTDSRGVAATPIPVTITVEP